MQFTHDDHFTYRYVSGHILKQSATDKCTLTLGHERNKLSFSENCLRTATLIGEQAKKLGRQLVVQLSGGRDSEVILLSFLQAGVDVTPLIIEYDHGLNAHDIVYAHDICQRHRLKPVGMNFNLTKFLQGRCYEVGTRFQTTSFIQQALLEATLAFPSTLMLTGDELDLRRRPLEQGQPWYFCQHEDKDGCWQKFTHLTGIPTLNFFTYAAPTLHSFLQLPTVQDLVHDRLPGKLSWVSSKTAIYNEAGFQVIDRPKYTGAEHLLEWWAKVREETLRREPSLQGMRSLHFPISRLLVPATEPISCDD